MRVPRKILARLALSALLGALVVADAPEGEARGLARGSRANKSHETKRSSNVRPRTALPRQRSTRVDGRTFRGVPPQPIRRNTVKLWEHGEVKGPARRALLRALRERDRSGRLLFDRIATPEFTVAYTLGLPDVPLDEVAWDARSHALREAHPLIPVTLAPASVRRGRSGQLRPVQRASSKESQYYDTVDFSLFRLDPDMALRWAVSYDGRRPSGGQLSFLTDSRRDPLGFERHVSITERRDAAGSRDIAALDRALREGVVGRGESRQVVTPTHAAYQLLRGLRGRSSRSTRSTVMELEPKIHLRSHSRKLSFVRTDPATLRAVTDLARNRAGELAALISATRASAPSELAGELAALEREARTLSAEARRASSAPDGGDPLADDPLAARFRELAARLDRLRSQIAGDPDPSLGDVPEQYRSFVQARDRTLARKTTFDPFHARHADLVAGPRARLERERSAFNRHGEARRRAGDARFASFRPLSAADFRALGKNLLSARLAIWSRHIEAGASALRALRFYEAERAILGEGNVGTGEILETSVGITEMYRPEDWASLPARSRNPDVPAPADRVFGNSLTADADLRPGLEAPFIAKMAATMRQQRRGRSDGGGPDIAATRSLLETYRQLQRHFVTAHGESVVRALADLGHTGLSFGPAPRSKREIAIQMLLDE